MQHSIEVQEWIAMAEKKLQESADIALDAYNNGEISKEKLERSIFAVNYMRENVEMVESGEISLQDFRDFMQQFLEQQFLDEKNPPQ